MNMSGRQQKCATENYIKLICKKAVVSDTHTKNN